MDADSECQKRRNGHLVSVSTQSEGYFVGSLIKNSGTAPSLVWIGLHDNTETKPNAGGWEWSNGDVLNYEAWEKGVPTKSGYCGAVLSHTGYEKWQNYDCLFVLPYVCKFES
ncbi:lithostathine-like [Sorex fumeus]|uniref:lithostathine-like n=1 Tax=Sorex fumeus TaxID=62283 RepID=UPI0024AD26BB|nr:lithostathine-like [Sorex fumeus]XP_055994958.1 lithostathine-like [Sorex fumeus]